MTCYPYDMDHECVKLCDALNELPGIRTFQSCCGHGSQPFRVFFIAESIDSLRPILIVLDAGWSWKLVTGYANGGDVVYFFLEGPNDPKAGAVGAMSAPR